MTEPAKKERWTQKIARENKELKEELEKYKQLFINSSIVIPDDKTDDKLEYIDRELERYMMHLFSDNFRHVNVVKVEEVAMFLQTLRNKIKS